MIRFSLYSVFKFLFGILLLQAATGVLVVAALRTENREVWILLGLFALGPTFRPTTPYLFRVHNGGGVVLPRWRVCPGPRFDSQ